MGCCPLSVSELIQKLTLEPHPEGGYYRRTYESSEILLTDRGRRPAMTSILYLLPGGDRSRWHRIRSNERWLHHSGGVLEVVHFAAGSPQFQRLGSAEDLQMPYIDVPADCWFAARPLSPGGYVLASCVVCPGFDFSDFEIANLGTLLKAYPAHAELILRFA